MDKKALIERLATFIPDDAEVDIDISIYRPVDDFSVYRFYGIPEGWRNPARRKNIERCDIKIGFVVVSEERAVSAPDQRRGVGDWRGTEGAVGRDGSGGTLEGQPDPRTLAGQPDPSLL